VNEEQKRYEEDPDKFIYDLILAEFVLLLASFGLTKAALGTALFESVSQSLAAEAARNTARIQSVIEKSTTLPISGIDMQAARVMAAKQAVNLITGEARAQFNGIAEIISQGLKDGLSPVQISRRLELVNSLDSVRAKRLNKYINSLEKMGLKPDEIAKKAERMKEKLLRERRETIARTETAKAQEQAQRLQADAAGKQYKRWIVSGDERTCPICFDNTAKGWVKIDYVYDNAEYPPAHPNCRCTIAYRKDKPDDAANARAQAHIDGTG
jgi:SPP1 gp7 family putative phage head morphogenesis protein